MAGAHSNCDPVATMKENASSATGAKSTLPTPERLAARNPRPPAVIAMMVRPSLSIVTPSSWVRSTPGMGAIAFWR